MIGRQATYDKHDDLIPCRGRKGSQRRSDHQGHAVREQRRSYPVQDHNNCMVVSKALVLLELRAYPTKTWSAHNLENQDRGHTKSPTPANCPDVVAKTIAMILDAMIDHIASKATCPSHKPTGFDKPFENCMACTRDRRSSATYMAKNAGYTAYNGVSHLPVSANVRSSPSPRRRRLPT